MLTQLYLAIQFARWNDSNRYWATETTGMAGSWTIIFEWSVTIGDYNSFETHGANHSQSPYKRNDSL
jgi:hypothetical protein